MFTVVFLCALFAPNVAGIFPIPQENLGEELLRGLYPLASWRSSLPGICSDLEFNACQANFDQALNISTALKWKDSQILNMLIRLRLRIPDFKNFLNVCKARQEFYSCLKSSFSSCVNIFSLFRRPEATWDNVVPYVELWKHLDFICNAGFEVFYAHRDCNYRVEAKFDDDLEKCKSTFTDGIKQDPTEYCSVVSQMAACYQKIFRSECGSEMGWFACEDARVGFAENCSNLRCYAA
ncbi:hypothetical protein L596_024195 [Steinernema carpocapsae]|uniref:DUF19 domain-containing protein n=1 Tax=Steinernema carpocapsae TaxID=34508 RepID=A0A4U5MG21_STECR|nr:hypothetical protein L596_024195 [Steinernema carpocapsae]